MGAKYELDLTKTDYEDKDLQKIVDWINGRYSKDMYVKHRRIQEIWFKKLIMIAVGLAALGLPLYTTVPWIVPIVVPILCWIAFHSVHLTMAATADYNHADFYAWIPLIEFSTKKKLTFYVDEGVNRYSNTIHIHRVEELPDQFTTVIKRLDKTSRSTFNKRKQVLNQLGIDRPTRALPNRPPHELDGSLSLPGPFKKEIKQLPGPVLETKEEDPLEPTDQDFKLKQSATAEIEAYLEQNGIKGQVVTIHPPRMG